MQKLKMHSPDMTQDNIAKIRELFPNCVTEAHGEGGKVALRVDFDLLRQELSSVLVEGGQERYRLDWPGKRQALLTANAPIAKTLRPCREESVDFDTTQNLFIEGDNLDALKLLQETYLGKVKMIYIDPPYNTGNDFIYEDDFAENTDEFLRRSNQKDEEGNRLVANTESNGRFHSDWLSMMYPRLKLARNLLRDDGVIFISCDDNEVHSLKKLCDEIFGVDNFIGCAGRITKKANNQGDYWAPNFDYIITYTKSKTTIPAFFGGINYNAYNLIEESGSRKGEKYQLVRLYMTSLDPMRGCSNQRYYIECPDGSFIIPPGNIFPDSLVDGCHVEPQSANDKVWRWTYKSYLEKKNEIVVKKCRSSNVVGENGINTLWNAFTKTYLNDVIDKSSATPNSFIENHINQKASHELNSLKIPFSFAKPSSLIKYLLEISRTEPDDINLDFFSGSATTAHAVMQLNAEDGGNRKFIMVQLPEPCEEKSEPSKAGFKTIAEIGKERIRRAGAKIKAELAERQSQNTQGSLLDDNTQRSTPLDIGFRVLKVDSSNMADVYYTPDTLTQRQLSLLTDNIKIDRLNNPEDLLFQVLLDWGVDLTLPIRKQTILGKTVFFVDENALVACFDTGLTEDLVKVLTRAKPLRVVFRDNGFSSDAVKINATQIFRQMSPGTEVKAI